MIVVVISDERVLTGWPSKAAAERCLVGWLAESRDRWGWVAETEDHETRLGGRGVPKRRKVVKKVKKAK